MDDPRVRDAWPRNLRCLSLDGLVVFDDPATLADWLPLPDRCPHLAALHFRIMPSDADDEREFAALAQRVASYESLRHLHLGYMGAAAHGWPVLLRAVPITVTHLDIDYRPLDASEACDRAVAHLCRTLGDSLTRLDVSAPTVLLASSWLPHLHAMRVLRRLCLHSPQAATNPLQEAGVHLLTDDFPASLTQLSLYNTLPCTSR